MSSPVASIPSPTMRGSQNPAANRPCPAVSRDNEVSDVESSEDGTSNKERKKREETLSEEDQKLIWESNKK